MFPCRLDVFRDKAQYPVETADLKEETREWEAGLVYEHYAEINFDLKILLLLLGDCFMDY